MNRLPPEILNKIFIRLNFNQRLVCMLVCRSWWRLLDGGSLFYTIELDAHKKTRFNRMLNMLEQLPGRGAQVSELDIILEDYTPFNRNLEELHRNLPSIQDFALELMNIETGTMPSIVAPAIPITKFKLYRAFFKDAEAYTQFCKYVTRKYTNMTDIEFGDHKFSGCDTNDKSQLCVNGAFDFYRLTGLSKRELTIYGIPGNIDPFEGLDAVGCRLKDLCIFMCISGTILEFLALSDQFKYIEQLTIKNTFFDSIQVIKNMPNLTKLSVGCDTMIDEVSLVDLLNACPPTLKSLYMDAGYLGDGTPTNRLDAIEILHIDVLELSSDIGVIISSYFPNLVELRLSGEIAEDITITIKNPHFQKATFTTQAGFFNINPGYGFSFLSPMQKETQYYFCSGENKKTQVPREDLQGLFTLSVVCLTEKNVDLKSDSKQRHRYIWEII